MVVYLKMNSIPDRLTMLSDFTTKERCIWYILKKEARKFQVFKFHLFHILCRCFQVFFEKYLNVINKACVGK